MRGVEEVPLFGFPHGVGLEPVSVDVGGCSRIFRQGARDLVEIWEQALAPATCAEVEALAGADEERLPSFPTPSGCGSSRLRCGLSTPEVLSPEQLLRSLVPLYLGRTASFVLQMAHCDAAQVEARHPESGRRVPETEALSARALERLARRSPERRSPCGNRC